MKRKKTSRGAAPNGGATKVDRWLERESPHTREALENASRHFDSKDALTANMLEAIYGQESSFGRTRRKRGSAGAAGDFQMERTTARRMGLTVTSHNDQRFDVDDASAAAAKYLKTLDRTFAKRTLISRNLSTYPIKELEERKKFSIAAYNAGEGKIAKAQAEAEKNGKNPTKWADVVTFLGKAGTTPAKSKEITDYVDHILEYEREFARKSKIDKAVKNGKPRKVEKLPEGGHWITHDGRHIFIEDKR